MERVVIYGGNFYLFIFGTDMVPPKDIGGTVSDDTGLNFPYNNGTTRMEFPSHDMVVSDFLKNKLLSCFLSALASRCLWK